MKRNSQAEWVQKTDSGQQGLNDIIAFIETQGLLKGAEAAYLLVEEN